MNCATEENPPVVVAVEKVPFDHERKNARDFLVWLREAWPHSIIFLGVEGAAFFRDSVENEGRKLLRCGPVIRWRTKLVPRAS